MDIKIKLREFFLGENVFLRVRPHKISIIFGNKVKLASCYIGPFLNLEIINLVYIYIFFAR